jgi:hypothetical protein
MINFRNEKSEGLVTLVGAIWLDGLSLHSPLITELNAVQRLSAVFSVSSPLAASRPRG